MIRDLIALLNYELKRRPALAHLAAQIEGLSEAEIRAQPVALPWMHEALIRLKENNRLAALVIALTASVDSWATHGKVADPTGVTRLWRGSEGYIKIGRSELLIGPRQLLWLDRDGLWIDTIFTQYIDPKLLVNTDFHGRMTRSEYYTMIRQGASATVVESSMIARQQFQIYRPRSSPSDHRLASDRGLD